MLFHTLADPRFDAPFQALRSVQQTMERLLAEPAHARPALPLALYTRPDAVLVRAPLPGIEARDVSIEIDRNLLTLSGQWPEEPESASALAQHRERPRGAFRRTLRLPFEIDAARVQARLERGVLEIELPRLERNPPVKIPVRGDAG